MLVSERVFISTAAGLLPTVVLRFQMKNMQEGTPISAEISRHQLLRDLHNGIS